MKPKTSFRNLSEFIQLLQQHDEMTLIREPVSPYLEISQLTDQASKAPLGGKGLLFTNVKGSQFPVATNLFGSDRRICLALGVTHLDQLAERIRTYMHLDPPKNLKQALSLIPMALNLTQFFPRTFKSVPPPCQEVVYKGEAVDLSIIPVITCWPKDAGPFITLPLVYTRSLVTGKRNVGMYRLQVYDKKTTGMHWHIHKDGSHYFQEYVKAGKRMPVAVAIGADPATTYAATAPMPRGMDEMMLAGFIRNKPVKMAKCLTIDMEVPACAEFVLEGYVDPGELRREGPFGDHTGYYSLADDYPVFHVTAITHRHKPVYNATLVGRPPMEDCYLAKATERIFLPMLQTVFPEIKDYWFPWEGVFHNICVVAVEKEYPGHAQKIMSGLWGQGQMSFCKAITVIDQEELLRTPRRVFAVLLDRLDLTSDITLTRGILDVLDHSSPLPNFGGKIGIDLTARCSGEPARTKQMLPPCSLTAEDLNALLKQRAPGIQACRHLFHADEGEAPVVNRILALGVTKTPQTGGKAFAELIFALPELSPFNIVLLFDDHIELHDDSLILWKLFNNVEPNRDFYFNGPRLIIDACIKGPMDGHHREWPEEMNFDITD